MTTPPRTPTTKTGATLALLHPERHRMVLAIEDEARASLDECEWCIPRHEWPCPTIPRCDEPGCEQEATCGWPSDAGYRRTCGHHYRVAKEPQP